MYSTSVRRYQLRLAPPLNTLLRATFLLFLLLLLLLPLRPSFPSIFSQQKLFPPRSSSANVRQVRSRTSSLPLPRLLRSSSIHHLSSETSLAPFPRTLSLSDHPRSLRLGLSLSRVRATYRHKPMLGQYFSVAAVISWTPGPR